MVINLINKYDIDKAFKYYHIDNKYKDRCYECMENINGNKSYLDSYNRVNNILNNYDFKDIEELWKYKDINKLFCDSIDPFITNLIILLSYKTSQIYLYKYNLDDKQITINKNRIKECFENDLVNRKYESVRISQMLWAFYFVRVRIIEIGRLQYELYDIDDMRSIIKIHIPGGSKLDYKKVINSIDLSKTKLKEVYGIDNMTYICDSWLLSNNLNEKLDKNYNINKFYNLFDVVDGEDCICDILNFVYQKQDCKNYNELQENTTLQKIIKKELIDGNIFYIGKGILKNKNYKLEYEHKEKDFEDVWNIEREYLNPSTISSIEQTIQWNEMNNDVHIFVRDVLKDKIVGEATLLPLTSEQYNKFMNNLMILI